MNEIPDGTLGVAVDALGAGDADVIRNSDPVWVLQTAQTIRWMAYYLIAAICSGVLMGAVFMIFIGFKVVQTIRSGGGPAKIDPNSFKSVIFVGSVANVGLLSGFVFLFERLTRAEPNRRLGDRPVEMWRKVGRVLVWVSGAWLLLGFPYEMYKTWSMKLDVSKPPPVEISGLVIMVAVFMGFGLLTYISGAIPLDFARRLGAPGLEAQARRILMYGMAIIVVWFANTVLTMGVFLMDKSLMPVSGCCGCPVLALLLVGIGFQVVETVICYPKMAALAHEQVNAAPANTPQTA